jgi:serine/threonine protein kinase
MIYPVIGVGSTVGNYEVLQKVGEGAMGSVFSAHHPRIGKKVALKVIHPELATNEEMLARFFTEARAVTQIGHENIVEVQDYGQTPEGESFIVMELLEGRSLGEVLKREGALPVARAVHISLQLANGLAAAHARGIIHRDLKPDNIMLIRRGGDPDFVKILDFGLAKLTGPGAGGMGPKTRTGSLLGTAHYMAPEQAESSKQIDHRVDVYALGCIIFQLLTGRVPFPGEGFGDVLIKHIREPPPLLSRLNPQVPKGIEKIVLHALAKKPEFRFATMEEFRAALSDPERFMMTMDGDKGLHMTPSDPLPAQTLPPRGAGAFDDMPVTISLPNQAPARLPQSAATVQGEAPSELQVAMAARRAAAIGNTGRAQAITAPSSAAARGQSRTVPGERVQAKKSGAGVFVVFLLIVGLVGGGGFAVWKFLLSNVTVTVSATPDGVEIVRGDEVLGRAPGAVKLPRSSDPVVLVFRKDGFLGAQRTVTPSNDVDLKVRLLPKPEETPEEPEPPKPPPPPKPEVAVAPPTKPAAPAPPPPKPAPPAPPAPKPVAVKPPAPKHEPKPTAERPKPQHHKGQTTAKQPDSPIILTPSF